MIEPSQITEFGKVFIYLIMGILFVLFTFFIGRLVALKRPNAIKLSSYECGEEPTGSSWVQFNSRFYVVALIFLLFDVEMVFIFPWATVFGQDVLLAADSRWGWLSLAEMFVFIGILLIGLMYVWMKGDLNWIKPQTLLPIGPGSVPLNIYSKINEEKYLVKEFSMDQAVTGSPSQAAKPAAVKPAFRPQFKKPST